MSETRDLNDSSSPDPIRSEIEDLLRSLVPRPPAIDRDALFFQAGMAAAGRGSARGRLAQTIWPAAAATLLVACGGLAIALDRASTALEAALAATASQPAGSFVPDVTPAGQGPAVGEPQIPATAIVSTSPLEDRQSGLFLESHRVGQTLPLERIPGRQLTVHGWVEAPPGSPAWEIESAPKVEEPEPLVRPLRLPTHLELLRSERG